MTERVVVDAGPPIHLGEIEQIRLFDSFDTLLLPDTVEQELQHGGFPTGFHTVEFKEVGTPESASSFDLDPGESAALAVASSRECILLTDDLAARNVAEENDIEAHGSVGIIVFAHSRGQISHETAVASMRALNRKSSLFISDEIIEKGIALLEENDSN